MKYLQVSWIHSFEDEPILLISEIDDNGFEIRKIEVYKDDSFGLASLESDFGGTLLSPGPVPGIDSIKQDPQFLPRFNSKEEFEDVWNKYISILTRGHRSE